MGFNYSSLIRLKHLAKCIIWKHRGYFTRLGPVAPLPLRAPRKPGRGGCAQRRFLKIACAAPPVGAAKKRTVKDKPCGFGEKPRFFRSTALGCSAGVPPQTLPCPPPPVQAQQAGSITGERVRGCAGTPPLPDPSRSLCWGLEREYRGIKYILNTYKGIN